MVRHAPQLNAGTVDGSIQQMMAENVTLNGGLTITGDLLVPGTPTVRLNGKPTYSGTISGGGSATPTNYQVTLNGNASLGHLIRRVDPVALPSVSAPPSPVGTRNVVINRAGQSAGNWSTLRNLTLNGNVGQVAVPAGTYGDFTANAGSGFTLGVVGALQPSVYHFQRLTLNGRSRFEVVGPVIVNLANGFNNNGTVGASSQPSWLALNLSSGNLTLNGSSAIYGFVTVPAGTVILNNGTFVGGVICDRLVVNGGASLRLVPSVSPNQPPTANTLTVRTSEDLPLAITLTGADPEGSALTFRVVNGPAHGTLTQAAPGSAQFVYSPALNFDQSDSFAFVVNDGFVDSVPATVTIAITPVNDPPIAAPKEGRTTEDNAVEIIPSGTDVENSPLTFSVVTPPAHGAVEENNGRFIYHPSSDYHGSDTFTYKANDGALDSEPAIVTLVVTQVNDAPVATVQALSVTEHSMLQIKLTGTDVDGDALTFRVLSGPIGGTLSGTAPNLTYVPPPNSNDLQRLTFVANDGELDSLAATITIAVINLNDPPYAQPGSVETLEDNSVSFAVVGSDPDSDPLTFTVITGPAHGALALNPQLSTPSSASYLYTPQPDYFGDDSFTFCANDGALTSATVTISIEVIAVNDPPIANAQALTTDEDEPLPITLTGSDPDRTQLTFRIVDGPTSGELSQVAPGSADVIYMPALNFDRNDRFTFVVNDGLVDSEPATVTLAVTPINDPPVAIPQSVATDRNVPIALTLSATDVDAPAGATFSYRIDTGPTHGTLALDSQPSAHGSYIYTPAYDYAGEDGFTFTASDGQDVSEPATVALTINATPLTPVIVLTAPVSFETPVNTTSIRLAGTVKHAFPVQLTINGALVAIGADGSFERRQSLTNEGANTISVVGEDTHRKRTVQSYTIYRITEAPLLTLTSPPEDRFATRTPVFNVAGTVGSSASQLLVNTVAIADFANGVFSHPITLTPGDNAVVVEARDALGNVRSVRCTILLDQTPPTISCTSLVPGFVTNKASVVVAGRVTDGQTLTINGQSVPLATDGSFSSSVPLSEGAAVITLAAQDAVGNSAALRLEGTLDTVAPIVAIEAPATGSTVTTASAEVVGTVDDPVATLTLNSAPVQNSNGAFRTTVPLTSAETTLTVQARDAAGNVGFATITIRQDTMPPAIAFTAPANGSVTSADRIRVSGTTNDSSATIVVNGRSAAVANGQFEILEFPLQEGENLLSAIGTDPAGNASAAVSTTITLDTLAPARPSLIDPPAFVKADRVILCGSSEPGATVTFAGGLAPVSVTTDAAGVFNATVLLAPNKASDVIVRATDRVGHESEPTVHRVVSDMIAPEVSVIRPAAGARLTTSAVEVIGSVSDANPSPNVMVNGQSVDVSRDGRFGCRLTLPDGEGQIITVVAVDLAGNQSQQTCTVNVSDAPADETAPSIVVLTPTYDAVVPAPAITITALITDESALSSIVVAGALVMDTDGDGLVTTDVTVDVNGEFTIVAVDAQGQTTTVTHRVQVQDAAPSAPTIQRISPESPTAEPQVVLYATAPAGLRYEVVGGLLPSQTGAVAADGKIVATIPLTKNATNALRVSVIGANGVSSPPATSDVIHDSISPTILSTIPEASAAGVTLEATIRVLFSEAVRPVGLAEIQVRVGAAVVDCAREVASDGREVTLTPSTPFAQSATVQVTIPSSLADLAGNTLGSAYTYTFQTIDGDAPATPVVNPVPPRTNKLSLTLTGTAEPLSKVSIVGAVSAPIAIADATGGFSIVVTLRPNSVSTLLVTASDATGNSSPPLTVVVTHDDQPFVLASSVPANAAADVAPNTTLVLTFNKPIDPASLGGVALLGTVAVPVTLTVDAAKVSLTPEASLEPGRHYEIVIPATVADLFGNRLGATQRIGFSTTSTSGTTAPIVYTAQPEGVTNRVSATISGYSTPGTKLLVSGGASPFEFPSTGAVDTTGLFTLEVPLRANAQNAIVLRAQDATGGLSASVSALDVRQDSIVPTVITTLPATGATDVDPYSALFVQFSESVQSAPLAAPIPAIRLFDAENHVVTGNWILSSDGRGATFYPTNSLAAKASHRLLIATTVRDLAGNPLATSVSVDFVTAATSDSELLPAPVLDPMASTRTTAPTISLTGSATAGAELHVYGGLSGATATVDPAGRFTVTVSLVMNAENPLAVVAELEGSVSPAATVTVIQSEHPPGIRILSPQPNVEYNNRSLTVAGVIDDPESVKSIAIGGAEAAIVGRFFFRQVILDELPGAKAITAVATLQDGSTFDASVSFSLLIEPAGTDTRPPIPRFIFPEDGDTLNGEVVEALLTVEEGVQLTYVDIDRVVAHQVIGNIFFIYAHMPQQGTNALTVKATDAAGLVGSATVNVVLDSIGFADAPTVAPLPAVTRDRAVSIAGTAEPGSTIVVLNGLVPVRTVVSSSGEYSVVVPLKPNAANHLQVVAMDAAGNFSPVTTVDLVHDDTAPAVVSTSPAADQTGVPQNASIEVRFSESLNPTTIVPETAVVLRSALGQSIQRNVLLSADGKTIRIVPGFKFLRSDTITVEIDASIADVHGHALGRSYAFNFATVASQTTVSGIVVDPQLRPLANVKVGIQGSSIAQYTSSFGTFLLDDAPVGDQILTVDARPDPLTGVAPQGDGRRFGYLEFVVPVRRDTDNSLGRPIFMVETDVSTESQLTPSGDANVLTFIPAEKDLAGFAITYRGGSARFADGTARGSLTATRIDAANIPDRLPSGAIPHFLVEIGPDELAFDPPASLGFPNVYDLAAGDEVIVFHFKYGVHNYTELGRATVGADGLIRTDPLLTKAGFVGIIPAGGALDLTRGYLEGRVVDSSGVGLAGISVNAIAGSSYVVTDASGRYSIPLPDVRLELIRTFATVSTDLGARSGESPSLIFQSEMVTLSPSGVTKVPDIVVDSFFLGGSIRYVDADGTRVPVTGLSYSDDGRLVSVDESAARSVEILVYRQIDGVGGLTEFDSEPYMRTTASLDRIDDRYDSSFALTFLGSLAASGSRPPDHKSQIPSPGDVIKLVAFDRKTGFYGETNLKIPAAAEANGGETPLDVIANLELRPPVVRLDINRVFFLDGIRRRANVPHRGIAFTSDEYVEFKTTWTTAAATPLNRPELSLAGRLRVNSIDYQTDYGMVVRGGESFRVLEIREALFPARLAVLQRDTDVGIETFSISRDGSFADLTLLPIEVITNSYGLAQASAEVAETSSKKVQLHILDLSTSGGDGGLDVSGRTLPKAAVRVGGLTLTADAQGYFSGRLDGATGADGLAVGVGDSLTTRFGEALTPVINALAATPPGLVPSRGAQGATVIINGAHFSPVPADNKVAFNGAAAQVQSASEAQLSVLVPDLASSGEVTVTVAGKKSNGVRFDFLSVGINNGSFEDGTLRAFTLEGSGQVLEQWKRVAPTDRQYMAFLDTMASPRDGVTSLTSDPFEVPAGMQTLLFDYELVATALLRPLSEVLEFYIVSDSETVLVNELFSGVSLGTHSPISGFDRGTGFRTATVLVQPWAGTGARIRVRLVLKGRGALPDYIPGMNRDDHNPLSLSNNQGTGLFLDNFRLSSGHETELPPIDPAAVSIVSSGAGKTITLTAGSLPAGARVSAWDITSGDVYATDVASDGRFTIAIPASEDSGPDFLLSYATPPGESGGKMFSPQTEVGGAQ